MKRKQSSETATEKSTDPLPREVLGEIAKQYQAKTMADVFRFISLCKSAADFIHLFLDKWIDSICSHRNNYHINLTESHISPSWRNRIDLREMWKHEKRREGGPRKEFLLNFFELFKDACCDKYYLRSVNFGGAYLCRPYKHNIKTQVSELFYFDRENDRVLPLKKVPGLRILDIKPKVKVSDEVTSLIEKNALPSISRMCQKNLKKMKESEIKSLYQEMKCDLGEPIKMHKPHKSSLVSNAMVGDSHLFSSDEKSRQIRESLYYCLSTASTKERMDIVYKYVTKSERMVMLREGLGPKPEEKEKRTYQMVMAERFYCGTH